MTSEAPRWRATLDDAGGQVVATWVGPADSREAARATLDRLVRVAWTIRTGSPRQPWGGARAAPDDMAGAGEFLGLEWIGRDQMRQAAGEQSRALEPQRAFALADAILTIAATRPGMPEARLFVALDPIGAGDHRHVLGPQVFCGQVALANGTVAGDAPVPTFLLRAAMALALASDSAKERHASLAPPQSATLRANSRRDLRAGLPAHAALLAGFLREAGLEDEALALEAAVPAYGA